MKPSIIVLLAAFTYLPAPASAAELPLPRLHRAHHIAVHRLHRRQAARPTAAHFGYYFGQWGWRTGGTASSWYGSRFVLAGAPWSQTGAVLASSPQGVSAIECSERRPDVCLAEPIVTPVRPMGRFARW